VVDATLADGAGPVPTAYELIRELDELLIPDDVQMLVLGRLDMLEADLKELVLRASVLGRSFQFGLLSALEERLGFSGPDYPARPLAALTAQSVLRSDAPGDAYFFEHLLTREAAYRALLPHNRRVLHSAAADILAALLRPGTVDEWAQLPELARHLAAAGRYAEAHTRWTELLLTAATTGRDAQWEEWEAAALDALRAAHPGDAAPPCTSAGLELARTEVVMRQMQYVPARAGFARALDLAAAAHDKRIEALALRRLGLLEIQRGDEAAAEAQLRRSLELMRELDNPGGQAAVYSQLLYLYRELQRYAEAEDCARRGLELARSAGDLRAQASLFNNLGLVLQATRGRLDEALECYVQALELNRAIGNRVGEAINADNLGGLCLTLGRSAEARRLLELAVQRYGEVGDTPGVGSAGGKLGLLQLRSGELEQAAATLQRSHAVLRVLDEPFWQALTEVYLGDLHLAQGDLAGARAWFEAAQATGADRDSPLINSAAAQGLAETAIAEGDFAAAERELGSARREAQRLGEAGDALQVDVLAARLQLARHAAAAGTGPDGASALEALRTTLDGLAERALELGLGPDSTALRNIRGLQAQAGGAAA
jgi:tetratricopeptide (TPR) repeat protein